MFEAAVGLGAGKPALAIRINGTRPTFRLSADRISAALVAPLAPLMADLLDISATVFAADSSVARGGATRPEMGNGWRRHFDFKIPAREPDFWNREEVIEALVAATTFLTDDEISFRFMDRQPDEGAQQAYLDFDTSAGAFHADEVILFSGGLDSFAGALEALSTQDGRVALVTHKSAPKVISRQERLGRYLAERFPGRVLHIKVSATRVATVASETTQRSRTLLFASLGQVVARMLGARRLSFYENGIVSHNLPISPQVIGTMATRTTHPLSLNLMNRLMALIGMGAVPIRNPFAWLTKTEVVKKIAEHGGASMIRHAVSCTSVRGQETLHTHCGACSQCLDRRFAILAAGLEAEDPPEIYRTDVMIDPRESDRSRTMAVDWSRHALHLAGMDMRQFMERFGQELVRIQNGHPSLPRSEVLQRCFDLHKRQGKLVVQVLKRSVTDQAEALVSQSLPGTSLLMMHIGGGGALIDVPLPRVLRTPPQNCDLSAKDLDIVPIAGRPLEVTFLTEKQTAIVKVLGLCRVEGRPAEVVHYLKGWFEEDRKLGRTRDQHRYVMAGEIGKEMRFSKAATNQYVSRCRKTLRDAFIAIHGSPPDKDILIESRRPNGYRLDPDIRIVVVDA